MKKVRTNASNHSGSSNSQLTRIIRVFSVGSRGRPPPRVFLVQSVRADRSGEQSGLEIAVTLGPPTASCQEYAVVVSLREKIVNLQARPIECSRDFVQ